jgi:hypothetical protein
VSESATATPPLRDDLEPVSDADHARCGLIHRWKFYYAPEGCACWLCGRPAVYATDALLMCRRHAQDF